MPLVTIIINIRNGAEYLREALDSVLSQTFRDWEAVIWDDCSTDDSSEVVRGYTDRRIRYFLSPEETHLGRARNNAICQATGRWLAFLDQDDIWTPDKLEKQMALVQDDVGIIYGRTVMFDRSCLALRDYDYFHEFMPLPEGDIFTELFRHACFIAMSSAVLRRSAVIDLGGIPDTVQVAPDYYLYVAIAHRYSARAVQDIICRYRVHPGNMTKSPTHRFRIHKEPLEIVRSWEPYLDPALASYRKMTYSTALAFEELKHIGTAASGARRLVSDGSLAWLLSRPFVRAWRFTRRRLQRSYFS